ncbi:aminotransferase class V-fold PLP-dependent enzyme [Anaerotignum sp.]|uniref:aminotransferase class V-fold PLP-dependent enzyme n=1 Tax=Anaerotignum sp. TaxID=2039241 RepID=UPI0028963160|nr:aminotransferase class V-fold PLP-dependent enzyme [Anaerotignum sp.]
MNQEKGILFEKSYQENLKEMFFYADADPEHGKRIFLDNSGGSLRLKKAVDVKCSLEMFPDCPERIHERSLYLKGLVEQGTKDILEIVFGAKSGALITELTASQTMFQAVGTIMENVKWGSNAVTSSIEHPSAYDAMQYYCEKTGREFRVVPANKKSGGIDPDEVMKYVDKDTCVLSIMSASNISGNIMDIAEIVRRAREVNPDIYIISDAVQHAPHAVMDVEALGVDAMNFAPYKFFGVRGCGFAYVSDRVATMRHHKLLAKDENVWELGTSAPGNFAAMMEVIKYVCEIGKEHCNSSDKREVFKAGMHRIHLQERALLSRMLDGTKEVTGLRGIEGVHVYVDTQDISNRDLIAAIGIDGIGFTECVAEYQKRGITVYERINTSVYSKRIVEALGLEGAIRVSPMHCQGIDDIDQFLKITKEIADEYKC